MSIQRLLRQPLVLQRTGTATDAYGNEVRVVGDTPVQVRGFVVQESSTEALLNRDTVTTGLKGFLPAGTEVSAYDYIIFDGSTMQVQGQPHIVFNPRTATVSHVEVNLQVIS